MRKISLILGLVLLSALAVQKTTEACTHITLTGADGTVVTARTMEWGEFDLHMKLHVNPRGSEFKSLPMPDKSAGMSWKAQYGFVGIDIIDLVYAGGVNEKGLTALMLYFPGCTEYQPYDAAQAGNSITAGDFVQWALSHFETASQVRDALETTNVVTFSDPSVGGQLDAHWAISDRKGEQIVVEYVGGTFNVYDAKLGVMTNSPSYDWHLTNLRNYINMRPVAWPDLKVADMDLKPLGVGSGMLGLPGDITPPSRFIRAVAFSQAARKTTGGYDTVRESFRILDNFNTPIIEEDPAFLKKLGLNPAKYSGTQYTTAYDMKNLVLYYHTDNNRTVRKIDLKEIDFGSLDKPYTTDLRGTDDEGVIDVTPQLGTGRN